MMQVYAGKAENDDLGAHSFLSNPATHMTMNTMICATSFLNIYQTQHAIDSKLQHLGTRSRGQTFKKKHWGQVWAYQHSTLR